jgi:hypothetical protein
MSRLDSNAAAEMLRAYSAFFTMSPTRISTLSRKSLQKISHLGEQFFLRFFPRAVMLAFRAMPDNARFDMRRQQFMTHGIERRPDRRDLRQYVLTVPVLLDHAGDALHLPQNAIDAVL